MTENLAFIGNADDTSHTSELNAISFMVNSIIGRKAIATIVKVIAIKAAGEVSAVGYLDCQPMVAQIDGYGKIVEFGPLYNLPYIRIQGGANAVIIDPQIGDIGLAVFCEQDIGTVKTTRQNGPPGSRRRNDRGDGIYVGGILNQSPAQYVQFSSDGIKIRSPKKITLDAPEIDFNGLIIQTAGDASSGSVSLIGPLTVTNDVTATGTSVHTHLHSGVTAGSADTGQPI